MNKKGQSLPLNTVVIAVLVILVLVVVIIFFLGGMGGLTSKIKTMFFGSMVGTDRVIAVQTCNTRCDQAKLLPNPKLSAYCTRSFNIDDDGDGEADKENDKYLSWFCYPGTENVGSLGDLKKYLNVPCIDEGKQIVCI